MDQLEQPMSLRLGQYSLNKMKIFVALSVLIAGSWAAPADPYSPYAPAPYAPAPYAPAPAPYHAPAPAPYHAPAPAPYHEEKIAPKPYVYEYGGVDASGLAAARTESQDADGTVHGEYRVELPDGRTQIVTYHASHELGYVADVKYEGVAKEYVPAPYHPAPVSGYPAPPYKSAQRAP